ncbi:MAG: hypothetical protein NT076_01250 [Candidatus Pacearchaeota archaeon]|nr:hypothetical protein [Candidatus Pacearchaeota archaeon]
MVKIKKTEQIVIMLTPAERTFVEQLANNMNGSKSQVLRFALSKLQANEFDNILQKSGENNGNNRKQISKL